MIRAHFKPARLNVLLALVTVIPTRCAAVDTFRNGVNSFESKVSGAWISSLIIITPYFSAKSAILESVSLENTIPTGLCGLQSR